MKDQDKSAYVRSALALQGYDLDEARVAEITLQFSRIADIAAAFLDLPMPLQAEPAPVFAP